jgi:hypothetical protein
MKCHWRCGNSGHRRASRRGPTQSALMGAQSELLAGSPSHALQFWSLRRTRSWQPSEQAEFPRLSEVLASNGNAKSISGVKPARLDRLCETADPPGRTSRRRPRRSWSSSATWSTSPNPRTRWARTAPRSECLDAQVRRRLPLAASRRARDDGPGIRPEPDPGAAADHRAAGSQAPPALSRLLPRSPVLPAKLGFPLVC